MPVRVRAHVTFANVVSLAALFVALSGGAYALTVPRNSVGSAQLKRNAVTRSKIKRGAITSSLVKDGALLARDFKPGQLPAGRKGDAGAPGPAGATGARGPAGATNVVVRTVAVGNAPPDVHTAVPVDCHPGERARWRGRVVRGGLQRDRADRGDQADDGDADARPAGGRCADRLVRRDQVRVRERQRAAHRRGLGGVRVAVIVANGAADRQQSNPLARARAARASAVAWQTGRRGCPCLPAAVPMDETLEPEDARRGGDACLPHACRPCVDALEPAARVVVERATPRPQGLSVESERWSRARGTPTPDLLRATEMPLAPKAGAGKIASRLAFSPLIRRLLILHARSACAPRPFPAPATPLTPARCARLLQRAPHCVRRSPGRSTSPLTQRA